MDAHPPPWRAGLLLAAALLAPGDAPGQAHPTRFATRVTAHNHPGG
ncbi:MAG: hypothetical protein RLY93_07310 [Sumerlaeia bacterium]